MAALGLVPLALGLGRPGHEIEAPMAITVLGGLTTATLLNLGVLPEALIRLGRFLGISRASTKPAVQDTAEKLLPAKREEVEISG
jgi:Cu/Ag efflux pump CusA